MNISIDRFAPAGPRAVRPGLALALALALGLAGCASGPRERDLLPDEGPTTLEVYERHLSGATAGETEGTGLPEPSDALDRVRPDGSAGPAGRAARPGTFACFANASLITIPKPSSCWNNSSR